MQPSRTTAGLCTLHVQLNVVRDQPEAGAEFVHVCLVQIFDDWKASSMSLMFLHPGDGARPVKFPQLSRVTLAFLESCCRGSTQHEWRVYDVCAVMRQQKERKREAALARPAKKSHHVADAA